VYPLSLLLSLVIFEHLSHNINAVFLGEFGLFISFYSRLVTVLSVSSLSHYLVSARILNTNEEEQLDKINNSTAKATFVLRKIAAHLEGGSTESFHSFLSLIEKYGDISSIQLVSEIRSGMISLTGVAVNCSYTFYCALFEIAI